MNNIQYMEYSPNLDITMTPQVDQEFVVEQTGFDFKEAMDQVSRCGPSYCLVRGYKCIAAGGLMKMHAGRAQLWVMLSEDAGKYMTVIHKKTVRFINEQSKKYKRLEATVAVGFPQGHRWMNMLGFTPDGMHRCYDVMGNDHIGYERITE